jgi:hypothetical protein
MGTLRTKPVHQADQFHAVNDARLRMTVTALADRYSSSIRQLIYSTYQDNEIAAIYRAIRASGAYQHGGKTKVRRKVIEFPNVYVADFCDTVLKLLYGPDWLTNRRALRHELILPWHVVEKL